MTTPPDGGDRQHRPSPFPEQQHPPPQFGPPAPVSPRTSRVGLIACVAALIVLVVAGVTALALASRPTVLDPGSVQRDVAAQFEEREGVSVDLTCPDDMEVASGEAYRCSGTTADGEEVTIEIRIADSLDGAYTWVEP